MNWNFSGFLELGHLDKDHASFEINVRSFEINCSEDTYRISISKAAEKAVVEVMEKVNQDFTAGQVNRSQLASWVLVKFADSTSGEDIRAIRMDHVNELALLEHYYREAKESGKLQPEVRDLIRRLAGIEDAQQKASKKGLKSVINDDRKEAEGIE